MEATSQQPKVLTQAEREYLAMLEAQRAYFGCIGCGDPGAPEETTQFPQGG